MEKNLKSNPQFCKILPAANLVCCSFNTTTLHRLKFLDGKLFLMNALTILVRRIVLVRRRRIYYT